MKILYVSQYYPPEMGAPSARVSENAREWARMGHDVTVLTAFPHHPTGIKQPCDRGVRFREELYDGVTILRTYIYATANKGTLKRMLSYASFMFSAIYYGKKKCSKPDVIIGTSPQLLCGRAGYKLARHFKVPFIFEVRDLWPESILAVEAMNDNLLIKSLKRLASKLYKESTHIVTVGEGYKTKIHELYQVPLDKMSVIPNGIMPEMFSPKEDAHQARIAQGWEDNFVVLYIGTHGMAHNLMTLLKAAKLLTDVQDLKVVLIGEGAEKDNLKKVAADWSLNNVEFMDMQPRENVPELYAACDLGVVMLRDTPLFREVLPSKLFEYLGMAKPVILTVDGQARQLVESNQAGWFVPPENPEQLAAKIRDLYHNQHAITEAGDRGRRLVHAKFTRPALAKQYMDIIAKLNVNNDQARSA